MADKPVQQDATVQVPLPTVGRIVHVRIDVWNEYGVPTIRPAIVLEAEANGSVYARVFLEPSDYPLAPGANIRNEHFMGAFGTDTGEWRWPEIADPPETFTVTA